MSSLSTLVADFLDLTPFLRGYSEATIKTYRSWLEGFARWAGPDATIAHVIPDNLLAYQIYRIHARDGGLKSRSLNGYRNAMLAFCSWLIERGKLSDNPARCIKKVRETDPPRRRVVTTDDLVAILAACQLFADKRRGHLALAVITTLAFSGMRRGELLALTVADVDISESTLLVRRGKGGKQRSVPVCARCVDALRGYLDVRPQSDLPDLFLVSSDWPLSRTLLQTLIYEALEVAHLSDRKYNAHAFRHWYATTALNAGANPGAVAENLGHSGTATLFKVYNHPSSRERRKVAEVVALPY